MNKRTIAKIVIGVAFTFETLRIVLSGGVKINPGLQEVKGVHILNQDETKTKNKKETIMYVYGRILTGEAAIEHGNEVPDGMIMLIGKSSSDGNSKDAIDTTKTTDVFVAMKEASDDVIAANNLIPLGRLSVLYFYMEEKIEGQDSPIVYITTDPNGPGINKGPVTDEEAGIYTMQNPETGEYNIVSFSRAEDLREQGWIYRGPCDRDNAFKSGKSVTGWWRDGGSEIKAAYYGTLDGYNDQSQVPGR